MLRHRRVPHFVLLALAIVLLAPLPGCNQNDEALPPIVIVTPAPVRGVIAETSYSGFVAGSWVAFPIPLSEGGKLDVSVNWTHEESWLYVYLGEEECKPDRLAEGTCPFLIESETQTPKPRYIESDILAPGTYYLYIYNVRFDPDTGIGSYKQESVRIVIGLTVGLDPVGAVKPPQPGPPTVVSPSQLQ
jgi:hypothetical protein